MVRKLSYNSRHKGFSKYNSGTKIIIAIIILSIIGFFPHYIRNTYKVTITNKRIERYKNRDRYLIYGQTDKGVIKVFQISDSLLEFRFRSKDIFWGIGINKRYEIKTYGFDIPMLPFRQHIVKVKAIDK